MDDCLQGEVLSLVPAPHRAVRSTPKYSACGVVP
jgi:hypothetical protein